MSTEKVEALIDSLVEECEKQGFPVSVNVFVENKDNQHFHMLMTRSMKLSAMPERGVAADIAFVECIQDDVFYDKLIKLFKDTYGDLGAILHKHFKPEEVVH